jgi:hypothetical protein
MVMERTAAYRSGISAEWALPDHVRARGQEGPGCQRLVVLTIGPACLAVPASALLKVRRQCGSGQGDPPVTAEEITRVLLRRGFALEYATLGWT